MSAMIYAPHRLLIPTFLRERDHPRCQYEAAIVVSFQGSMYILSTSVSGILNRSACCSLGIQVSTHHDQLLATQYLVTAYLVCRECLSHLDFSNRGLVLPVASHRKRNELYVEQPFGQPDPFASSALSRCTGNSNLPKTGRWVITARGC